jgi:hypothetical protein
MIARTGSGWQFLLADLSLILFMITAAALAQTQEASAEQQKVTLSPRSGQDAVTLSPQGQPLAVYRAEPGAPPLARWLGGQSADARQQLTIVAQFRAGEQGAALEQAQALAREAGELGRKARIVIEPGEGGTTAALAFDDPAASLVSRPALARDLLNP